MDAVNDDLEAVSISMAFLEVSALSRALTKARLQSALNRWREIRIPDPTKKGGPEN